MLADIAGYHVVKVNLSFVSREIVHFFINVVRCWSDRKPCVICRNNEALVLFENMSFNRFLLLLYAYYSFLIWIYRRCITSRRCISHGLKYHVCRGFRPGEAGLFFWAIKTVLARQATETFVNLIILIFWFESLSQTGITCLGWQFERNRLSSDSGEYCL